MHMTVLPPLAVDSRRRSRVAMIVILVVCVGALAFSLVLIAVGATVRDAPFVPTEADGVIPADTSATIDDGHLTAIARLSPALRAAVADAALDASADGIVLDVTSGWRSEAYQRWLFDDAVQTYRDEALARQFVASPESSSHVTGDAVDVGPVDAQFWLIEHGAAYGLCQTYANERWHFELATTPGGVCPDMLPDASHG